MQIPIPNLRFIDSENQDMWFKNDDPYGFKLLNVKLNLKIKVHLLSLAYKVLLNIKISPSTGNFYSCLSFTL